MNMRWIVCSGAAMTLAGILSSGAAEAAMPRVVFQNNPLVQHVDCAVGFRLGPIGTCILGVEEEHSEKVIEHRATDDGCETNTVKRTDGMGNTETRTKTNCD